MERETQSAHVPEDSVRMPETGTGNSFPPPPLQLEASPDGEANQEPQAEAISQAELMALVDEAMGGESDEEITDEQLLDPLSGLREGASNAFGVPESGWNDLRPMNGRPRRMRVSSFRSNLEMIRNDPEVQAHILATLEAFANDPNPARRRTRDQIDLPLVLAIASRESGNNQAFLSPGDRRVVTGGRLDTHNRGEGGLDNIGRHLDELPESILERDQPIDVNSRRPAPEGHPVGDGQRASLRSGLITEDRHPAYMPESTLLAAYIVEVESHYRNFELRFRNEMAGFLTGEQTQALLDGMSVDAKRSWTQARFGSHVNTFISRAKMGFRRAAVQAGWTPRDGDIPDEIFQSILENNDTNLNAIVTSDSMIENRAPVTGSTRTSSLSGHRVRISTAEAWMFEMALPLALQNPEGQRSQVDELRGEAPAD